MPESHNVTDKWLMELIRSLYDFKLKKIDVCVASVSELGNLMEEGPTNSLASRGQRRNRNFPFYLLNWIFSKTLL